MMFNDTSKNIGFDDYQKLTNSAKLFKRAEKVFPGGTTRLTTMKDPFPIYVERGEGAYLYDLDGNQYIDFLNNFASLIHGHAFPPIVDAIQARIAQGTCFANPTICEIELAEVLCQRFPGAEQIRFCNSGTEAVMFAIKAARAFTGRYKIAKLEGAFHGLYDWAEISEASTPDNWGDITAPNSTPHGLSTPPSILNDVVPLPFNHVEESRKILEQHKQQLAAILICLMPSRAGLIPLTKEYIELLREFSRENGILLIDDEVMCGRLSGGGAAKRFGLEPDLLAMGKIIGGGLPIGAIAGRKQYMSVFDNTDRRPDAPQTGTFSANPLSMVAGTAALNALDEAAFTKLDQLGDRLREGLRARIAKHNLCYSVTGTGSMFKIHPKADEPTSYRESYHSPEEAARFKAFWSGMLTQGFLFAGHGLGLLSTVMTTDDIDCFIDAFENSALKAS